MTRWIQTMMIFLITTPVFSQVRFSGIREILEYADKYSTVARQGNVQRAISDQELGMTRAGLLPRLNVFASADHAPIIASQVIPESVFGGQDGKFRKVQFGMPWNFSSGLELGMPLVNLEKWAQLEKSKLQSLEISWSHKSKLENLHIQITQWFYQALMAKEMMRINEENIHVANELMRMMEERKINGVLDPADYNRSKNLQLNVQTAQEDYLKLWEQSLIKVRSLINLPSTVEFELKDSLTGFSWPLQNHNSARIAHRALWSESFARTEVARQAIVESKRAMLPKLSLFSRYAYNWQSSKTQQVSFDVNTIGLRLDYTLFNGGYHRRQEKRSELQLKSAYINQQQAESVLIEQQQEWSNNYNAALAKKEILQKKVQVAADNLRIARLTLKEGVIEFDAFNNIFYDYNRAQVEQLQNLSDGILYHFLLTNHIQ